MPVPPLTFGRLVTGWALDPLPLTLAAAAGLAYATGVRRLSGRGRRWPALRSAAFAAGLATLVVATQSAVAAYDAVLFSAHAAQHVLLGMLAPALLALGAPVTLALQASGRRTRRRLLRALHSRPLALVAHPVPALAAFGGLLVAVNLTSLHELSLRHEAVHGMVHLLVLASGCLFLWPLVSPDPVRPRLPPGARVLAVFLTVPFHAIVGLAVLSADGLLAGGWYGEVARTWGPTPLADQRAAGGLLWAAGDLVGLALVATVMVRWMVEDARAARGEDRRLDAGITRL